MSPLTPTTSIPMRFLRNRSSNYRSLSGREYSNPIFPDSAESALAFYPANSSSLASLAFLYSWEPGRKLLSAGRGGG